MFMTDVFCTVCGAQVYLFLDHILTVAGLALSSFTLASIETCNLKRCDRLTETDYTIQEGWDWSALC